MIPIDPKDIRILKQNRNTEFEKFIMDEYNGDISFLYTKNESGNKCLKKCTHITNFFLYIIGRK